MTTPVRERHRFAIGIDRARRDLTRIALASALVGIAIFCTGLAIAAVQGGGYPLPLGTAAGVFVGIAVDLGIALGVCGVALELARNR